MDAFPPCGLQSSAEDGNDMVYLAALLHDIGKPEAQFRGKREGDPDMHYYGHPEKAWKSCATSWSRSWTGRGM